MKDSPRYCVTDHGVNPNSEELQTKQFQAVLDLCKARGGKVIVPAGNYRISSLRLWSDTTLCLCAGARLEGSEICEDYEVFPVSEGIELRTDMEMIPEYYHNHRPAGYRRAMISAYGGKNIAIIGEPGSHIDGMSCADPYGEEGYRGPHGIFITNVDGIELRGYHIANCGNFKHQLDNCRNITVSGLTCTGGSDGFHLHFCKNVSIENCRIHTGDDCIAGINIENMTVKNCELNTSCNTFRVGGSHVLVENCRIWGPGIYPHRMTVVPNRGTNAVRDRKNDLPVSAGRHNLLSVWQHFACTAYPHPQPYHDIVFRDCRIENADIFLEYLADTPPIQIGTHLCELTLENVAMTGLGGACRVKASAREPLRVKLKNVSAAFRETAAGKMLFDGADGATTVINE